MSVLILPLPFQEHFSEEKIRDIGSWVESGGGLLLLGHYAADVHHGSNPSQLTRQWGLAFEQHVVLPPDLPQCHRGHVFSFSPQYAATIAVPPSIRHPLVANVSKISLISSGTLETRAGATEPELILRSGTENALCEAIPRDCSPDGSRCSIDWRRRAPEESRPVLVAFEWGDGRVVVIGSWKIVDPNLPGNQVLLSNAVAWLADGQPAIP